MSTQEERRIDRFIERTSDYEETLAEFREYLERAMRGYAEAIETMTLFLALPASQDSMGRPCCNMCGAVFNVPEGSGRQHHGNCPLPAAFRWLEHYGGLYPVEEHDKED